MTNTAPPGGGTAPRENPLPEPLTIGVDVGGTRIKAGLVAGDGSLRATRVRDSPGDSAEAVAQAVVDVVGDLRSAAGDTEVAGVGVAAAGFVDHAEGVVLFAPHLPWREEPLRDRLSALLDLPVGVDNDANAAAWAEHRFGAGRGQDEMVMITLGTGLGGAHLAGGRLQRGRHGLAGEYGHMVVVPDGRDCPCGRRGCWEQYASGTALRRAGRAALATGGASAEALLGACGGMASRLQGEHVTRAALAGDLLSVGLLAETGRWLGLGLANLAAALDPACVVVGGGVIEGGELVLGPAREALTAGVPGAGRWPVPEVRSAALGNSAGLIGAADLVRTSGRPTPAGGPTPP
ncbi:ROK family protein [Ornithinimicrobium tianjinense]|uniref:Glucokinase n=1 Tax=Ornithinimicrobium tianjinense TaxID=1195761 RepID=A0A917BLA9_9MICO|nr:ROK family protein [Ornithinimicrobium tianjinense]GGF45208.1 glucokinase [Ornithinimicrobium tianjinense]